MRQFQIYHELRPASHEKESIEAEGFFMESGVAVFYKEIGNVARTPFAAYADFVKVVEVQAHTVDK